MKCDGSERHIGISNLDKLDKKPMKMGQSLNEIWTNHLHRNFFETEKLRIGEIHEPATENEH